MRYKSKTRAEKNREREEYLLHWHKYFAWFPVRCHREDGSYQTTVWLEYVERRGTIEIGFDYHGWNWFYRTSEEAGRIRSAEMAQKNLKLSETKSCGNCDKCKCPK